MAKTSFLRRYFEVDAYVHLVLYVVKSRLHDALEKLTSLS